MSILNRVADNTTRPDRLPTVARLVANGAIISLWVWFYWPLTAYLSIIFSDEGFRTNQVLLAGILLLIAMRMYEEGISLRLDAAPRLAAVPLALAGGASLLYLLVERFLDVNTVSASLFVLASYGLLGLWLSPHRWRQGLPAALLLMGTLPFGDHLQTFVGYPMRIVTAAIVRDGLALAGVHAIGIDTILVFENSVSQVDLPCSGVKSLWTGGLFLIAATWLERRPLTRRWLGTAVLFAVLLFLTNLARVAILVSVGEWFGWRLAADMLHVPLGVLGFALACAAAVALLRRQRPYEGQMVEGSAPRQPAWLAPALIVAVLAMGLVYTPRPQTGLAQTAAPWTFPAGLAAEPMPLTPTEHDWLARDGAESADRWRFQWHGLSGSMILITSNTWRAHHRPERCFEVYGLTLEEPRTQLVTPYLPVRFVSLGNGDKHAVLSATYWFQSADHATDDYATRIWADLKPQRDRWVLVSVLFDDVIDPRDPDVQTFYLILNQTVNDHLKGGFNS
jgi:exosortase O